ncbi:L-histidine N(alpha)-methyltransferase [Epibacterium sp. SM1969]|uniref:L-histidine N(Alpha)-methyltransferase n=1 Tax=Tritonibacter aquimaris TaxID=2663379 RepID=A0A844AWX5_9RHOB|nr:L-histidine N(alpha)-methyltransferase [Tritonibacter aquimaris]MQY44397.1 L-histidine N(alpha)-methyltransferase [Tritonibacter aquimaris]
MSKSALTNIALANSALHTLSQPQKSLESKWFYDHYGSELFEQITKLPEYYPTRTETAILQQNAATLAALIPPGSVLVELGSGSSTKTRLLLDAAPQLFAYAPLDISGPFLHQIAAPLRKAYPHLHIIPIVGDFMQPFLLPSQIETRRKVAFFPGSTIGNLEPKSAVDLLKRVRAIENIDALILGADLVKDEKRLVDAYDDSAGVTAAFNLNLLARLNREAKANFSLEDFHHKALWNPEDERIEMHLISNKAQTVHLMGQVVQFAAGETIHTENSHKYRQSTLQKLATQAGWSLTEHLVDAQGDFSVNLLRAQ